MTYLIKFTIAQKREARRWYQLKETAVQLALVRDDVRFKVVPAGRRSGKTERAKRYLAKRAMKLIGKYFACAPTHDQARKIWWDDLKALTFASTHANQPSESKLTIFLDNGSEIHIFGLDKPARIEGIAWDGGIIDEIADIKQGAWEAHIKPALDTFNPLRPEYKAWCWLIGVPDGLNHYYDLYQYALAANDPEWKAYTWKSSDILPESTIEAAKRSMSAKQYKQEYEASFETASGRIYEDYSTANHTNETIKPHEALHWSHDQNYTPLSSCVSVVRGNAVLFLDEIVLTSAISRQSALEFVEKFKHHENKTVYLYGDPAGRAGEKHGHKSDYTEIEAVLKSNDWTVTRRVAKAAPAIKDRQNAVRAKIKNAAGEVSLFVNPITAKWCDKGLSTVQVLEGSTYQEDQKNQYQHITTAMGYQVNQLWPNQHAVFEPRLTAGA